MRLGIQKKDEDERGGMLPRVRMEHVEVSIILSMSENFEFILKLRYKLEKM